MACIVLIVDNDDNERGQQHARQEADAAEPGNGVMVNLAAIGLVIQSFLLAKPDDLRDEEKSADHAQEESCNNKKDRSKENDFTVTLI